MRSIRARNWTPDWALAVERMINRFSSIVQGGECKPKSVWGLKPGDKFNPSRKISGLYFPEFVNRARGLGNGPKRLYDHLVRRAGTNGECWPSYERMASELGMSVRQVKSDIATLERWRLITHKRRGRMMPNLYSFLWHPIFDGITQPGNIAPPRTNPSVPT